jgi:dUTP pyrophosphatase
MFSFVKLTNYALPAVRDSPTSTTFDVRSAYTVTVPAKGTRFIKTDMQVQIPEGVYVHVTSHSGLALQQYIDIIDHNYGGNIGVFIYNHSENLLLFGVVI